MAEKITINDDHTLNVSDNPIIPFIEGDGTGIDIWPAVQNSFLTQPPENMVEQLNGLKFSQEKKHSTKLETGYHNRQLTLLKNT